MVGRLSAFSTTILLLVSTLAPHHSKAQTYGNEWIDYSQKYYAFKIAETGVYRIRYAQMTSAGIPVSSIDPATISIYSREQEIPIHVVDGGDGTLDAGDYLEFYAKKNDAWLDSLLYDDPAHIASPEYSLVNDTIEYFLTWKVGNVGKRFVIETDLDTASFTPLPYFINRARLTKPDRYMQGEKVGGQSSSLFTAGEGWYAKAKNAVDGQFDEFKVSTPEPYQGPGAPNAICVSNSAGLSNAAYSGAGNHHMRIEFGSSSLVVADTIYRGYEQKKIPFTVSASHLSGPKTTVMHRYIDDQGANSDYQATSFVEILYAQKPKLAGVYSDEILVPQHPTQTKSRLDLSDHGISSPVVYVVSGTPQRIAAHYDQGVLRFLIPNDPSDPLREVVLSRGAMVPDVQGLEAVNGTGFFTDYSVMNLQDPFLIVTSQALAASAQQYASYRGGLQGGAHDVLLVNVEELCRQFGGGVPKHILGVRRFCHLTLSQWVSAPSHLFLLGKGVREATEGSATLPGSRKDETAYRANLVPAFGYPSSDNLITAGLVGPGFGPDIPTGRLAAKNDQEVLDYLDKVTQYESMQDSTGGYTEEERLWQKRVLHFGGGSTASEQGMFQNYLSSYQNIIQGMDFGGQVTSFFKTTSDPIDPVLLNEVTERIRDGVSLMTFFGHASASGFDQNIDAASNWNNSGKYPLVYGNACYTGDIHQPVESSQSEEFVLIPDEGAIGFLATTKLGFSTGLNNFASKFYKRVSSTMYGATLGEQITDAISQMYSANPGMDVESVMTGMTLHGDPAIRLNPHGRPEYELSAQNVYFTPEKFDLSVDSLEVHVIVTNLGRASADTLRVDLVRDFPGQKADSTYSVELPGVFYSDTVVFRIPLYSNIGVGLNKFTASIDIPSVSPEQVDDLMNNTVTKELIINLDGAYPVYPFQYGIVPIDTVTLKASTVNAIAQPQTYMVQLDTTDLFNSPLFRSASVTTGGGVISVAPDGWAGYPPLSLEDSTVYFWRVAMVGAQPQWKESSFQYIPGRTGWAQAHFFQMEDNDHLNLEYSRADRERTFGENRKVIQCDVYGNASYTQEWYETWWKLDGQVVEWGLCGLTPSLHVAVLDPYTLEPWGTAYGGENPDHSFGNANDNGSCRAGVEEYFIFRQNDPAQLAAFQNMVLNEIPDSAYFLVYTTLYADYSQWDVHMPGLYSTFQSLGADSIAPGKAEVPFIMLGKKGDTAFTREVYGQFLDEFISLTDTLIGPNFKGTEFSTIIGPTTSWRSAHWEHHGAGSPVGDSTRLSILGVKHDGVKELLVDMAMGSLDSLISMQSTIDASIYPYLQLSFSTEDSVNFTPTQLERWQVVHDEVPEFALNGELGYHLLPHRDTVYEGEEVEFSIAIENIGRVQGDSLLVKYWVEDAQRKFHPLENIMHAPLEVGGVVRDTIRFLTAGLEGLNSLWVAVNPKDSSGRMDQPERWYFNNLVQVPFRVVSDRENPLLEVTFDGVHILDGDIVSPRPHVVISLLDENPHLVLNEESDTANFGIYLTLPSGEQKRIYFQDGQGQQVLSWTPGSADNNRFRIHYEPEFTESGEYQLLVQGSDKSGNLSGDLEYKIAFQVETESSITHLVNYPNPFSTSTRFVFTLTGTQPPDEMKVEIYTASGRLVREVFLEELGHIRIGRNITDFAWDGTDNYGDRLANGVYLYRVIARLDGEELELRQSGADQFFTKGYGKMYLMR